MTLFAGPGRTRHLPLAADLQTTGEDPVDPSRAVSPAPRAAVDHSAVIARLADWIETHVEGASVDQLTGLVVT